MGGYRPLGLRTPLATCAPEVYRGYLVSAVLIPICNSFDSLAWPLGPINSILKWWTGIIHQDHHRIYQTSCSRDLHFVTIDKVRDLRNNLKVLRHDIACCIVHVHVAAKRQPHPVELSLISIRYFQ